MKKLLLFLVTVFLAMNSFAQAEFTVADGTSTNEYVPVYPYYFDQSQTNQVLYPADMMAPIVGSSISKLTFYISGTPTLANWTASATVTIATTTATTMTSEGLSMGTDAVAVDTVSPISAWVNSNLTLLEIEFATPYVYEGGSLLLQFAVITAGDYDASHPSFYGTTTSTSQARNSYQLATYTFLPKCTFTYTPPEGFCWPVYDIATENLQAFSTDINWSANESNTSWTYQYKVASEEDWSDEMIATTTSVSLSDLLGETNYQIRIKANCGGSDESGWVQYAFTTPISCPAPTTFEPIVEEITSSQAKLTWNNTAANSVSWEDGYTIQYKMSSVLSWTDENYVTTLTSISDTFLLLTDLVPEMAYSARIKAVCAEGDESDWALTYFTTLPTCPNPHSFAQVLSETTESSAKLTWMPTVSPVNWEEGYLVQYKLNSIDSWDGDHVTTVSAIQDTFLLIESLAAGTYYNARLKAVCAAEDSSSSWQTVSFATTCNNDAITTFPFEEGFELDWMPSTNSDVDAPLCWTVLDRGGLSTEYLPYSWVMERISNARSGQGHASIYTDYGDTDHNDWLITPKIALTGEQRLVFWAQRYSSTTSEPDEISIFISAEDAIIDTTGFGTYDTLAGFTRIFQQLLPQGPYAQYIVDLSEYAGNRYVAFVRQGTADGYKLRLDDVSIEVIPSCMKPTELTSTNPTETSIELSWTSDDPENESAWNIYYKPSGTAEWQMAAATENPFTLEELSSSTIYEWRVQVDCATGFGEMSDISTFATACSTVELPWTYGFEELWPEELIAPSTAQAPLCWTNLNKSNPGYQWERTTSASYRRTGEAAVYLYSSNYSVAEDDWLITPPFELTGADRLTFFAKNGGYDEEFDCFISVKIISMTPEGEELVVDITDEDSYVELIPTTLLDQTWRPFEIPLTGFSGPCRIAFVSKKPAGGNYPSYLQYTAIDDITVDAMPDCPGVNLASMVAASPTSVAVSWDVSNSNQSGYNISYTTDVTGTFDPESGTIVEVDMEMGQPYIITDFEPGATVWAAVQQACGGTWSTTMMVTLPATALELPLNIDFEDEDLDDQFALHNEAQTNQWFVGALGANESERGLYISSDNGATFSCNVEISSVNFFSAVVAFNDAPEFEISFDWLCEGDFWGDFYLSAYLVPYHIALEPGMPISTSYQIGDDMYAQADWATENIVLPASYGNQVYRLAFQWMNPGYSASPYTPAKVDNIEISVVNCGTPTELAATNITASSAVINWTDPNEAQEWLLQYKASNDATWTTEVVYENPFLLEELSHSTLYEMQIAAVCSESDTTVYSPIVEFFTECLALTVPTAVETFTNTTMPPSECWERKSGLLPAAGNASLSSGGTNWIHKVNTNPNNTGGGANINIYSTSKQDWLISPSIDLGDETMAQIEFDLAYSAYGNFTTPPSQAGTDDRFAVVLSTDDGATWNVANAWIWDNAGTDSTRVLNDLTPDQQHVIIKLANENDEAYTGVVKIAFYGESTMSNADNDLFVDNFEVVPYSSCQKPTQVVAVSLTDTEAAFSWTELGESSNYEYVYAAYSEDNNPDDLTPTSITAEEMPAEISGLTAATDYQFWVRANCGEGENSMWVLAEFRTIPTPATLPYAYNVETATERNNWGIASASGVSTWATGTAAGNGTSETGTTAAYISPDNGTTYGSEGEWNIFTYYYRDFDFGDEGAVYNLVFDYKCQGYATETATGYSVGAGLAIFVQDPSAEMNTTGLPTFVNDNLDILFFENEWTTANIELANITGVKRLMFMYIDSYGSTAYIPAAIDNISITASSCPSPAITSVEPTTSSAVVNFEETGADSYLVVYRASDDPEMTTVATDGSPCTITDLESGVEYLVALRAVCGTDTSVYSPTTVFLTPCYDAAVSTFPWNEGFESGINCWSQENVIGTFNWTQESSVLLVTAAQEGTSFASFFPSALDAHVTKLISPVLDITGLEDPYLSYYHVQPAWGSDQNELKVYYRTDDTEEWVELEHYTESITAWTFDSIPLPEASATYQIAFEGSNDYGYAVGVDNVTVSGAGETADPCDMPTDLVADNVTDNSADLTWDGGTATAWQVRIGTTGDVVDVTAENYTATSLASSTEYTAYVRTDCGDTQSNWATVTFTTTGTPCDAPDNVTAVAAGPTSVDVTWTGDAANYNVQYREGTSGAWASASTTETSYTIEGLTAATGYQVQVQSVCENGESPWSPEEPVGVTTETQMYVIVATAYGPGTIDPVGTSQFNAGASPIFTFVPDANAVLERVEVSGVVTPVEDNEYQFPALTQNETIDAYFEDGSGISESDLNNAIRLYPNPATTQITLTSENVEIESVEILDMTGRIVLQPTMIDNTINITTMETGVYFARVTTASGVATLRFVKQ